MNNSGQNRTRFVRISSDSDGRASSLFGAELPSGVYAYRYIVRFYLGLLKKQEANFMGQIGCPIFGTNIDPADNEIKN